MIFDFVLGIFARFSSESYRVLDQYLVANFFAFIKGFEVAIFMTAAIIILLIAVGAALRQLKRLPKSYFIEITDITGRKAKVEGLRQTFSTYEAAESYAQFYRKLYERQYTFKVIGSRERIDYDISKVS